ncbi:hypothetical protein ACJX0J_011400, partial [Zea mays]
NITASSTICFFQFKEQPLHVHHQIQHDYKIMDSFFCFSMDGDGAIVCYNLIEQQQTWFIYFVAFHFANAAARE